MSLRDRAKRADQAGKALSKDRDGLFETSKTAKKPAPSPKADSKATNQKQAKQPKKAETKGPTKAAQERAAASQSLGVEPKKRIADLSAAERQRRRRETICQLNVELLPVERAKLDAIAAAEGFDSAKDTVRAWINGYKLD